MLSKIRLNQRFGFVWYGNKAEGLKAIKMWNAAQIQGHNLLVKIARFTNTKWNKEGQKRRVREVYRVVKNNNLGADEAERKSNISNTPVLDNQNDRFVAETGNGSQLSIKVSEVGNEWLSRSAITKLSCLRSMVYMQDHLKNLGFQTFRYAQ